jgi:hypothetical protein
VLDHGYRLDDANEPLLVLDLADEYAGKQVYAVLDVDQGIRLVDPLPVLVSLDGQVSDMVPRALYRRVLFLLRADNKSPVIPVIKG